MMAVRIFLGLTDYSAIAHVPSPVGITAEPLFPSHYASLRATGYPDTSVEDDDPEECVRIVVASHRNAMRCRRADRRRQAV
jgi:hypothetical protein